MVLSASVLVVGVVLAAQSQDRFTLKSANGIAFSEFRAYDEWQPIAASQPDKEDGCGISKVGRRLPFTSLNDGPREVDVTCRIDRLPTVQGLVLHISGRITRKDLDVLRTALEDGSVVAG